MESLWGFSNRTIKADITDTPHGILKEQLEHFGKNTNEVLYGRIQNFRITDEECDYPLGTSFQIVAPALDKYVYVLFTMYCKPESDFPVLIYNRELEDPTEPGNFTSDYTCNNKEEFIDNLKKILSSDNTTRIVQTLYSKSNL